MRVNCLPQISGKTITIKKLITVKKDSRYWSWIPFLCFIFSTEFLKKNKGKILNYLGNDSYNHELVANTLYVHYPRIDATPTGFRMRLAAQESDTFTFCGFGRSEEGREGFVRFTMDENMLNSITFSDVLPTEDIVLTAVRQGYYPGLNPAGTKMGDGLIAALEYLTYGDAPQLAKVKGNFQTLDGTVITAANIKEILHKVAPKSLLTRVFAGKPAQTNSTTTTTDNTATTTTKREVKPIDW